MFKAAFLLLMLINFGCTGIFDDGSKPEEIGIDSLKTVALVPADTVTQMQKKEVVIIKDSLPSIQVKMGNVPMDSIIGLAQSLIGTRYKYGSVNPAEGFDCSGFITYVFSHFNIKVPRSSIDFTNVGKEIPLGESKKGDLILFTGTDSTERFVGHMGIVTRNESGAVEFIHSSSGKANGVVITPLNSYYMGRFVKVIRLGPF